MDNNYSVLGLWKSGDQCCSRDDSESPKILFKHDPNFYNS